MGSSAGGNIAYHVGLRAATTVQQLEPLNVKGLVLHQPFFGGNQRSKSELRLINDPVLLPIVSEYCNPTVGSGSEEVERVKLVGWKVLVNGCDGNPLVDRQSQLAALMEAEGV
ncbi:carboxylesterase 1-like [Hibiscus syriacus]|uniref:Carboxylesterase 1-like n=1 Tax=Hibiscus syriacus TaxID=106335 RepID=A0A6A3CRW2_HIBSY|nr:carboxylesterase 1-like [Hibiscus syriacus]